MTRRLQQCFIRLDMDMKVTLGFPQMNLAKRKNNTLTLPRRKLFLIALLVDIIPIDENKLLAALYGDYIFHPSGWNEKKNDEKRNQKEQWQSSKNIKTKEAAMYTYQDKIQPKYRTRIKVKKDTHQKEINKCKIQHDSSEPPWWYFKLLETLQFLFSNH